MMQNRYINVRQYLPDHWDAVVSESTAFAPVNIALIKYWGKRDEQLYLPVTDSFSIALQHGTTTTIRRSKHCDRVECNGNEIKAEEPFFQRAIAFLDLFRPSPEYYFYLCTFNDLPTAAGLASSASGFAALIFALNRFFGWNGTNEQLSALARLGSGSASRSLYPGFVEWKAGIKSSGEDSYAVSYPEIWPELRLGVFLVSEKQKPISSREAMKRTVATSPLYAVWPQQVRSDMKTIKHAIAKRDFDLFGQIVERNALCMHATMHTSTPVLSYWLPETVQTMSRIWKARQEGRPLYFTMDAGPNVKLLFLEQDEPFVSQHFPELISLPIQWDAW